MNIIFSLGFRVFFLGAASVAILSIAAWTGVYLFQLPIPMDNLAPSAWHAHEMIYGYSIAVVAGFLLTAVRNWTKLSTPEGKPLMLMFALWAAARLLLLGGSTWIFAAAAFDLLFILYLTVAVALPIIKSKQWRQMAVLSKLALLAVCNACFYLGALGILDNGVFYGIYGGFYLLIALILTMGRRVLPFFIERGVGYKVELRYKRYEDILSLLLLVAFLISELFLRNSSVSAWLALGIFIVNASRLIGWHTKGIWSKSLLWSLYLSFWCITLGFLLFACSHFFNLYVFLALHALAYGGIGMVTISMMSRVSLGHTGRSIATPSKAINAAFMILLLGLVFRVIAPLLAVQFYTVWIGISQALWISSFTIFLWIYTPILSQPRADNL